MFSLFNSILCDQSTEVVNSAASAVSGAAEGEGAGFNWSPIIMIVVMIVIFYFLLIRPQSKRQKKIAEMRKSMRPGDTVITTGGIYGKIVEAKENAFIIQVSDGVRLKVDSNSVFLSPEDIQQR